MSKKLSEQRNFARRFRGITMPISRKRMKWGRNWPCLCGSGKKYKKCCIEEIDSLTAFDGNANVAKLSEDIQKMIDIQKKEQEKEGTKRNG